MARRTSLYQRARSPLIQGRSKTEQPLWQPSLIGVLIAAAAWVVWYRVSPSAGAQLAAVISSVVTYLLGAAVGAVVGAYVARAWGSRSLWLAAAVVAVLAAFLSVRVFAGLLPG